MNDNVKKSRKFIMKKNLFKCIFSLIVMTGTLLANKCCLNQRPCRNGVTTSNNTFLPRPFSSNSAREILMTKSLYENYQNSSRDEWYGIFTTATEFSATIHRCDAKNNLGTRPFWSGSNTMTYGTNNGQSDVDAYQFGMGDIKSVGRIKLDPHVQQAGVDMMLHFVQHFDRTGFYFKLRAPMVGLLIDPRMSEPVKAHADDTADSSQWSLYPAPTDRPRTLAAAFAGGRCDSDDCSSHSKDFRAMFGRKVSLEFGQISVRKESVFRMADISFAVGVNIVKNDDTLMGFGFKVACPTGNVAKCKEILEPIVGRGGLWAIGFETFGHYKMYESDDETYLNLCWQGELYHLAHGRTSFRSFDLLRNGPGSKYMLVEYYQQSTNTGVFTPPGLITQAINLTTLPVKSSFNIEASLAAMIDGHKNNWEYGIGGEVWGRSHEKLSVDCAAAIKNHFTGEFNDFAVLGRQRSGASGLISDRCEPFATINTSENFSTAALDAETNKIKDAKQPENRIPAAICDALDIGSAMARQAFTGKLFGNIGYCWKERNYQPHISLYGATEFTGCYNNAMDMWTLGLQGSLQF